MARRPSDETLRRRARERFATATRLEKEYMRSLRMVARQIDHIVKEMAPNGDPKNTQELYRTVRQYGDTITPWAQAVAEKMVSRLARKDETAWIQMGKDIGRSLRTELQSAPTGAVLHDFLREQVRLITSLPYEAAERVMHLVAASATESRRASEIAKDILETGKVTESRAKLIARTEVARMAAGLTMVRAQHVGATHYIWRTSGDSDVRDSHKRMNGKVIAWEDPPEVDPGKRYHAGMFPNCRCYPEPILSTD